MQYLKIAMCALIPFIIGLSAANAAETTKSAPKIARTVSKPTSQNTNNLKNIDQSKLTIVSELNLKDPDDSMEITFSNKKCKQAYATLEWNIIAQNTQYFNTSHTIVVHDSDESCNLEINLQDRDNCVAAAQLISKKLQSASGEGLEEDFDMGGKIFYVNNDDSLRLLCHDTRAFRDDASGDNEDENENSDSSESGSTSNGDNGSQNDSNDDLIIE